MSNSLLHVVFSSGLLALALTSHQKEPEFHPILPSPETLDALVNVSITAVKTIHLGTDPSVLDLHDANVLSVSDKFKGPGWDGMFQSIAIQDLALGHRLRLVVDFLNENVIVTLGFDSRLLTENEFQLGVAQFLDEHPTRGADELTEGLMRDGGDEVFQSQMSALLPIDDGAFDENLGHTSGMFKATVLNLSAQQEDGEFNVEVTEIEELLKSLDKKQNKFQRTVKRDRLAKELLPWTLAAESGEGTDLALLLTLLHEAGHQVYAKAAKNFPNDVAGYVPVKQNVSRYGLATSGEAFGEGFVWFILDPAGMKDEAPEYFAWVEKCWELANK
ncbi:hypothetical protein VB780_03455 [Leptolyngbya sp. CCNP1308]|uniref:hypothetical protein n=1 Tax=Leptolyngbya sp. CCNP1308 TaxID=3110255 RepID=UPI002B1FF7F5|nr:hypothetical protein [Leptolyngbya sp. CCNP1308]MEA5447611.1 hypothetical protein [Leptolyngbya sp. CCNP1308]